MTCDIQVPRAPTVSMDCVFSVGILVAHSAALVCAGLASMLRSTSEWDVRTWDETGHRTPRVTSTCTSVVIGDAAMLSLALAGVGGDPRVLLVADKDVAMPASVSGRVVASVSLACRAEELIETIRGLIPCNAWRRPCTESLSPPRGGLAPGALRRVREYIRERLAERIELRDLAGVAGLSDCHFARSFRQSVGLPPHHYVMQLRIESALALIRQSDRPLAQIALDLGFYDQSHFTRTFARLVGETPCSFRRRHR
jgi:AraC-like DNA-binding protein